MPSARYVSYFASSPLNAASTFSVAKVSVRSAVIAASSPDDRQASIFSPPPADHGGQRVAGLREGRVQLDAGDRLLAVDAGEEALADQLGAPGVGLGQVQEDVVRPFLRGRDARDVDAIERQHEVVEDAQPAAARRPAPARRRTRRSGARDRCRLLQGRARVRVAQLEPPRPGEVEDRVQVAQLRAVNLEERPRSFRLRVGRRGRRRVLRRRARRGTRSPRCSSCAAKRHSATGTRRS